MTDIDYLVQPEPDGQPEPDPFRDDPFSPDSALAWQLVMQMRIYDVLMGIMNHLDEKTADVIYEAHQKGLLVSKPPRFDPTKMGT